jgi:hypothetical protein
MIKQMNDTIDELDAINAIDLDANNFKYKENIL